MVGWHHRLDGRESEQTLGDGEGQGSLACCSPWDCRVKRDLVTEQNNTLFKKQILALCIQMDND